MKKETYLMNPMTGSVDTEENWKAEEQAWDTEHGDDEDMGDFGFDTLIEVEKDADGEWVEVKL
jgi:hypothetical protein